MVNTKYNQKYFTFEHRSQLPLPINMIVGRLASHFSVTSSLVICALGVGILGYHVLENLSLTDSFLNASMILGGIGPVNAIRTEAGNIFAGLYALFSGLIFLVAVSLVIAPLLHHLLHRFHFEENCFRQSLPSCCYASAGPANRLPGQWIHCR